MINYLYNNIPKEIKVFRNQGYYCSCDCYFFVITVAVDVDIVIIVVVCIVVFIFCYFSKILWKDNN